MKGFKAAIKFNSCDSKLKQLCHIVNLGLSAPGNLHHQAKGWLSLSQKEEGRAETEEGEEVIDSIVTLRWLNTDRENGCLTGMKLLLD